VVESVGLLFIRYDNCSIRNYNKNKDPFILESTTGCYNLNYEIIELNNIVFNKTTEVNISSNNRPITITLQNKIIKSKNAIDMLVDRIFSIQVSVLPKKIKITQ
jgi:hypothetical protein